MTSNSTKAVDRGRLRQIGMQTASILGAATLLALLVNAISPAGLAVTRPLAVHDLDARFLTTEETKARYDTRRSVFLDARRSDLYQRGHIAGAFSLPADDFDDKFTEMATWLPKEADIVVYCDGKACTLGHQLADKLTAAGYTKLSLFRDGWPAWKEHAWPSEP